MKRVLLIVVLLLGTLAGYAQTNQRGVSSSIAMPDRAEILLACMNHSGFQNYYAAGAVNIVNLPGDIQLLPGASALGHSISLADGQQASNGTLSNYFTLGKITGDNEHVNVSLTYFYNHNSQGYKVMMAEFVLDNNGGQYQISNSNYNGDL